MTRRIGMTILAALLASGVLVAQTSLSPGVQALTAAFSSSCAATTCATWPLNSAPVVTIAVTGTFSGTITWEGSSDGGQTYFTISLVNLSTGTSATTTTTTGQFSIANSGLTHVQARMTSWVSGGANVSAARGYVGAKLIPFSSGNPVSPANGGTGISSYAIGDLLYASAATTLSKLADVTAGSYLRSGGVTTAPLWSTLTLPNAATTGDLLAATGTNAVGNIAAVATGQVLASAGTGTLPAYTATPTLTSVTLGTSGILQGGTNVVEQRNSTSGQTFRVYNTFTDASNYERLTLDWSGATFAKIKTENAGTGSGRDLVIHAGGSNLVFGTSSTDRWKINSSGHWIANLDNTYDIGVTGATRPRSLYLGSPSVTVGAATGLTVNNSGEARTLVYKVTLDKTAFVCAATTCDVTIGTLPANTWLVNVTASLTQTFACTATCTTSTLSAVLGKGSGGAEYLASLDADAATGVFGDADAELGTLMVRASAIQGGTFTSGTQAVVFRLTSGTGNIGNGSVTNLSQGSITVWLTTRVLP